MIWNCRWFAFNPVSCCMWYTYVLPRSYVIILQLPHEKLYTKRDCNSLGITSLKQKREERRFVDLRIFLILHCGNEFFNQVLNFCFKLDDNVPRYGSTIKSSFLGTVGITFFGTFLLNSQLPNEIRCTQSKLKSSEIVKCQSVTVYIFDPRNFHSA